MCVYGQRFVARVPEGFRTLVAHHTWTHQKRPTFIMSKETYIHVKRDPLTCCTSHMYQPYHVLPRHTPHAHHDMLHIICMCTYVHSI